MEEVIERYGFKWVLNKHTKMDTLVDNKTFFQGLYRMIEGEYLTEEQENSLYLKRLMETYGKVIIGDKEKIISVFGLEKEEAKYFFRFSKGVPLFSRFSYVQSTQEKYDGSYVKKRILEMDFTSCFGEIEKQIKKALREEPEYFYELDPTYKLTRLFDEKKYIKEAKEKVINEVIKVATKIEKSEKMDGFVKQLEVEIKKCKTEGY